LGVDHEVLDSGGAEDLGEGGELFLLVRTGGEVQGGVAAFGGEDLEGGGPFSGRIVFV